MFTGIVEELGLVKSIEIASTFGRLKIEASKVTEDTKIGDSIAVNGACLTVVDSGSREFSFDLAEETIRRTNLSQLNRGDRVNLERSLKSDGRFSGHFVSGHIDEAGLIKERFQDAENLGLQIEISGEIMPYLVDKGSICVDGVSLTVVDIGNNFFTVSIIPQTKKSTTLGWKNSGKSVNIEVDILGKYIHRFAAARMNKGQKINTDFLKESGFI